MCPFEQQQAGAIASATARAQAGSVRRELLESRQELSQDVSRAVAAAVQDPVGAAFRECFEGQLSPRIQVDWMLVWYTARRRYCCCFCAHTALRLPVGSHVFASHFAQSHAPAVPLLCLSGLCLPVCLAICLSVVFRSSSIYSHSSLLSLTLSSLSLPPFLLPLARPLLLRWIFS